MNPYWGTYAVWVYWYNCIFFCFCHYISCTHFVTIQAVGNRHSALRRGIQCMQPTPFYVLCVSWIPRRSAEWQIPRASLIVSSIYLPFLHIIHPNCGWTHIGGIRSLGVLAFVVIGPWRGMSAVRKLTINNEKLNLRVDFHRKHAAPEGDTGLR